MPAIHENLKALRTLRGLSQAEVAEAIHVTRQTVSSYETGRTQPDWDTLRQLADLYRADWHDVLYGGSRMQRKLRLVRRLACALSAVLLLGLLIHSALYLVMNTHFFVANGGQMTDENHKFIEVRFALRDAADAAAGIATRVFQAGCLVLFHPLVTLEKPLSLRVRIAWVLGLLLASYAVVTPFMLSDRVYGHVNYLIPVTFGALPGAVLLFAATLAADVVRGVRTKKRQSHAARE